MDSRVKQGQYSLLTSILLSSILLGSCSAAPNRSAESSAPAASPVTSKQLRNQAQSLSQAEAVSDSESSQQTFMANSATSANPPKTLAPPLRQKAQLIKTATLRLTVKGTEQALQSATNVVTGYGGDILSLRDQVPEKNAERHTAAFEFRVPQEQLDAALLDLAKLGTVEARSIQAEDVTGRLVDFDARLKNLRKAEGVVLGIMERSGSIGDVLKVSQELSRIRNEIEQIQGQVQHLRQQVAYSRINLTLEEAIARNQKGLALGDQLQESWSQSTHAMGKTTANLLRLGIWLLVFSPYYLLGGTALIILARTLGRRSLPSRQASAETSVPSEH
jgi:Domain of unknown function (DUF4349)